MLGLQTNSDNTDHQCYVALETLKENVQSLPEYRRIISGDVEALTQNANTILDVILGNNPDFQIGTYFKLFKRAQEI